MMVLLTTVETARTVRDRLTGPHQPGAGIPLSRLSDWRHPCCPVFPMFPTFPAAVRAGFGMESPAALLAINCLPIALREIPEPYPIGNYEIEDFPDQFQVRPLPTEPGTLGVDAAVAVAIAQMAAAAKIAKDDRGAYEVYMIQSAALSAAYVCSARSVEILEQMAAAYHTGSDTVPWPDEILWPDTVGAWLQGFGYQPDTKG